LHCPFKQIIVLVRVIVIEPENKERFIDHPEKQMNWFYCRLCLFDYEHDYEHDAFS